MTKTRLIEDFENGRCAITWHSLQAKAEAVYLNGERETIRFDTYCSLRFIKYPTNKEYSHGFDYWYEWTFVDDDVRDAFMRKFLLIKKRTGR